MKRVSILLAVFLCLGSLCSCEKEEKGLSASDFVGIWAPTDEEDITCYWEFKSDGTVQYYELAIPYESVGYHYDYDFEPAYFSDGVLYAPSSNSEWKMVKSGYYLVEDNHLFYMGKNAGEAISVSNNMFVLQSDVLVEGTIQRVNRFDFYDSRNHIKSLDCLKGKWWNLRVYRPYFNGEAVFQEIIDIPSGRFPKHYEGIVKMFFSDTNVSYEIYDEGVIESETYAGSIELGDSLAKLTDTKAEIITNDIWENVDEEEIQLYKERNLIKELVLTQYKGKTIYLSLRFNDLNPSSYTIGYCCYYDDNGARIFCSPDEGSLSRESRKWEYLEQTIAFNGSTNFDYIYDSEHLCFVADKL